MIFFQGNWDNQGPPLGQIAGGVGANEEVPVSEGSEENKD
jgi:hypothetical protein